MYDLYQRGVGGILGDEMGLGKTAQLCCHFGSLARSFQQARGKSGIFLVVCPATVLNHWLKEMHMWCPALRCVIMHHVSKTGSELHNLGEDGIELVLRRLQRSVDTQGDPLGRILIHQPPLSCTIPIHQPPLGHITLHQSSPACPSLYPPPPFPPLGPILLHQSLHPLGPIHLPVQLRSTTPLS